MIRALVVNDAARAAVDKVLSYATEAEHWYYPNKGQPPPGANPAHVTELNTYRCVYSITVDDKGVAFKHLSVSVPAEGALPHPLAFSQIAELFGFKDPLVPGCNEVAVSRIENCIVIAKPITTGALN